MRYAPERREAVLKKMLPPHNRPIRELAREEGISEATLYLWRKQARAEGRLMPDADTGPEGWTSRARQRAIRRLAGEDLIDPTYDVREARRRAVPGDPG